MVLALVSEKSLTEKKRIEFPNSPPLWRATSRGSCSHTYFTHPVWLPGGRGFVFTSDRTGSREAFLCEWPSGRIHQLTEGGASSPVVTLHGKSILYVNEGEIKERHLDGEENLTLAEIPPGTNSSGIPGETIDGKWIVIGLRNEEGSVLAKFPRGGGDMVPFHTDPRYMSHLIPSPGDPEMLSVAWILVRGASPHRGCG